MSVDPTIDQVLPEVNALLKDSSELEVGDKIVFVTVTLSSMVKRQVTCLLFRRLLMIS